MQLIEDQKTFWKAHSYLVFRGLLVDRIGNISGWINSIAQWPDDMSKWLTFYEMNDQSKVSRIENFVPHHEGIGQILLKSVVTEIIGVLMGERAILYKDRINFKPSGGGAHAAHQDGVAYESGALKHFDIKSAPYISVLISIDPATKINGCFEVASEWPIDKSNILPMERPYDEYPNFSKISQVEEDRIHWVQIETQPGDVIFFTERLPHRSSSNKSSMSRRILYGVYNPVEKGDKREKYYEDKRKNINDIRYMVGNPHAPTKMD